MSNLWGVAFSLRQIGLGNGGGREADFSAAPLTDDVSSFGRNDDFLGLDR
jgi:hypothetical protein